MEKNVILIISLIILTSVFDTINQVFLKSSVNSVKISVVGIKKVFIFFINLLKVPRLWIGFTFSTISLLIWLFVLSKADLNFSFSIDSMHYIFIAFASRLFLKEKIGVFRWIGTILIMTGITIVSIS